jgi:hypothetical protein
MVAQIEHAAGSSTRSTASPSPEQQAAARVRLLGELRRTAKRLGCGYQEEGAGRPVRKRGREWQPSGEPEQVNVHDFPDPALGKAIPYGVYDLGRNTGWVGVGTDHDTAAFEVQTLRRWWQQVGSLAYPEVTRLLVCADAGGSNGYRVRAWKLELAKLAQGTGLVSDEGLAAVPLVRDEFHGEWNYTLRPAAASLPARRHSATGFAGEPEPSAWP